MELSEYIEKEIIGKRFILALMLIVLFAFGYISEGIVGAVIGYYFGSHQSGSAEPAA
jgi:hypothetical protein